MKKITKEVLDIYVQMVAMLTDSSTEATGRMLDLYYQIRSAYEDGRKAERKKPQMKPVMPKVHESVRKPERSGENSPTAKAAFKRETLERLRKALKEKRLSYPKIAEAAGIDETKLIRIMEGKQEPVEVYRKLAAGLDRLES